jgi:hypothetical protein
LDALFHGSVATPLARVLSHTLTQFAALCTSNRTYVLAPVLAR